jgi:hypothetical protein
MRTKLPIVLRSAVLRAIPLPLCARHDVSYGGRSRGGGVLYGYHTVCCTVVQVLAQSTATCPAHRYQSGF